MTPTEKKILDCYGPDTVMTLDGLVRTTGSSRGTVQDTVQRMVRSGQLTRRRSGRIFMYGLRPQPTAWKRALALFAGDELMATRWMNQQNRNLDGKTPQDMIDKGVTAPVLALLDAMDAGQPE